MKKLITLLALNVASVCAFAQITITNADMPSASDTFRLSTTINAQGLDPDLSGANFTWDFSTLVPDSQRVDSFFIVGDTPSAYQVFFNFPFLYPNYAASYAKRGIEISVPQVATLSEVFNYTKNSSSALDNVGFGANLNNAPISVQNDPIDKEYLFPMNYNQTNTSLSAFELTVPGLGHYGQDMERINTVDGWGSLVLPNGTYDVLRVKSVLNKIDTIYIDSPPLPAFGYTNPRPEEIEYKWLAAGTGAPVLKIVTNAGIVSSIEYQDDFYTPVGVKELPKMNNVVVFPNPTKHHLVIDYNSSISGDLKVNLKDMFGKNVAVIYQNFSAKGTNKLVINLTQHSVKPGIYFVEMMVDDQQYYTAKVVVTK